MNRFNQIVEVAGSSVHLPAVVSFLIGLLIFRKDSYLNDGESDVLGDNVPTTLLEGIGR